MNPEDFHPRFIASLPAVPPDLDLHLDEFYLFSPDYLAGYHLSAEDHRLLSEVGFPKDASPYLGFSAWRGPSDLFPAGLLPIGGDGGEGVICVDGNSGHVVLADLEMPTAVPAFMNRTLLAFAECLCVYQEHRTARNMDPCFARMTETDSILIEDGRWWRTQIEHTYFD